MHCSVFKATSRKKNDYTKQQQQTQKKIYIYIDSERKGEWRRTSSVEIYVQVGVANISVVLDWMTENKKKIKEKRWIRRDELTGWCCCDSWFLFSKISFTLFFNFNQCTFEIKKYFLTITHTIFKMSYTFITS